MKIEVRGEDGTVYVRLGNLEELKRVITIIIKEGVVLHASHAEIPEKFFNPVFDREPIDFQLYRFTDDNRWLHCTGSHGSVWEIVEESSVPAAARLAASIG